MPPVEAVTVAPSLPRPGTPPPKAVRRSALGVALLAAGAYLVGFCWAMQQSTYDVWGAFLVAPGIIAVSVPLLRRAARAEQDSAMAGIVVSALVLKLVGAVVLYVVASEVYKGVADASFYHDQGRAIAESLKRGDFTVDVGEGYQVIGTGFIAVLTGIVYAVIGPTRLGGFMVFSWLGFWGLYLFYRAFCLSFPVGRRRRYAALVFFLPSLVFWSSAIGKEAWMTLALGLTAYGLARLVTHRRGGLALIGLGLTAAAMVRPHVALLVLAGLAVASLLRRSRGLTWGGPAKVVSLLLLLVAGVLVVGQLERFLKVDDLDLRSAEQAIDKAAANSSYGGSAVGDQRRGGIPSPLDLPKALVTVLFRPFPTEANNLQSLVASAEGVLLMCLFGAAAGSLARLPVLALRYPYVAFAVVFTLLSALAFSGFGNFGLLARERVQLFPLVLVVLALPRPVHVVPTPPSGWHRSGPALGV